SIACPCFLSSPHLPHPSVLLIRCSSSQHNPLSLHDALPICGSAASAAANRPCSPTADATLSSRKPMNSSGQEFSDDATTARMARSEEHTSELQSRFDLVCRLLLEKKNTLHQQRRVIEG